MGSRNGLHAAGSIAVLHRLSEDCGSVRFVRRRQSAELREPECVQDPRRFGHGDVVDVGRTQALFSYRGVARRRGPARASRHEENRQRGLGAARLRGDRGGGGLGVDAATSRPLPGAAFEQALDSRHRYAVKPLYGRQEGAVVGYNPKKPGRPSHCYHTYSMAGTRLVFDVDVCAGDEHASNHAAPALWALLDRTARDCWPTLLRGDKGSGNEKIMREAELRALAYLFKLRLTANVRRAIERLSQQSECVDSGQGWQAKETQVRLKGWSRQRRIIVLRRRVKGELATPSTDEAGQRRLTFVDILPSEELWEYQVLATSLVEQLGSFGQLYRDRADGENIFDELKNQWGWGGFVTQDLARCRLAARMVALFYDWWNIFVRLAEPDWHREAITSRPLLLHAIAERVRHARQTTIRIASMHARSAPAAEALRAVAKFLPGLVETAEQLAPLHRWREILSRAFQAFLKGRPLRAPLLLKPG